MAYSIPLMALARGLLARQGAQNLIRGRSVLPASRIRAASSPTTAATTVGVGVPTAIAMRDDLPEDKLMGVFPRRAEGDTGASTRLLATSVLSPEDIHGDLRQPITPEDIHGPGTPVITPEDIHGNLKQAITPEDIHGRITPSRMPLPVKRPAQLDAAPQQQSLLSRIFSGQDYQSSNALASDPRLAGYSAKVVQDGKVNWGDRDNAADFFRADAARMAMEKKAAEEGEGKAKGGAVAGKDAALHKALEIIHHLLTRGH